MAAQTIECLFYPTETVLTDIQTAFLPLTERIANETPCDDEFAPWLTADRNEKHFYLGKDANVDVQLQRAYGRVQLRLITPPIFLDVPKSPAIDLRLGYRYEELALRPMPLGQSGSFIVKMSPAPQVLDREIYTPESWDDGGRSLEPEAGVRNGQESLSQPALQRLVDTVLHLSDCQPAKHRLYC